MIATTKNVGGNSNIIVMSRRCPVLYFLVSLGRFEAILSSFFPSLVVGQLLRWEKRIQPYTAIAPLMNPVQMPAHCRMAVGPSWLLGLVSTRLLRTLTWHRNKVTSRPNRPGTISGGTRKLNWNNGHSNTKIRAIRISRIFQGRSWLMGFFDKEVFFKPSSLILTFCSMECDSSRVKQKSRVELKIHMWEGLICQYSLPMRAQQKFQKAELTQIYAFYTFFPVLFQM